MFAYSGLVGENKTIKRRKIHMGTQSSPPNNNMYVGLQEW